MPEWAWPASGIVYLFALHVLATTYKGGLHFTVICCANKCILLLIDRAIRRNWVMLYWLVDKYRMTQ